MPLNIDPTASRIYCRPSDHADYRKPKAAAAIDPRPSVDELRARAEQRLPLLGDGDPASDPRANWRPWTAEEDALLATLPVAEAAQRVGRSKQAVHNRRNTIAGQLKRWGKVIYGPVTASAPAIIPQPRPVQPKPVAKPEPDKVEPVSRGPISRVTEARHLPTGILASLDSGAEKSILDIAAELQFFDWSALHVALESLVNGGFIRRTGGKCSVSYALAFSPGQVEPPRPENPSAKRLRFVCDFLRTAGPTGETIADVAEVAGCDQPAASAVLVRLTESGCAVQVGRRFVHQDHYSRAVSPV